METRNRKVKHFFDQTDLYLKNAYGIRARVEIVQELLGNVRQACILDIGCGDGSLSRPFLGEGNQIHLLDLSDQMIKVARQNCPHEFLDRVTFINTDFLTYTPKHLFDVILCVGVLAHVGSVDHAIALIAQLLSPGGRCILQFSDQTSFLAKIHLARYNLQRMFSSPDFHNVPGLSAAYILDLLRQNKLCVERQMQYSLLLPGMGKLPQSLLYRWLMLSLRTPALSRFGTEKIMLIRKSRKPCP